MDGSQPPVPPRSFFGYRLFGPTSTDQDISASSSSSSSTFSSSSPSSSSPSSFSSSVFPSWRSKEKGAAGESTSLLNGPNALRQELDKSTPHAMPPPRTFNLPYLLKVLFVGEGPDDRPYFNLLLVCLPLCIASRYSGWGPGPTFALSLLALLPLAERLGFCTEKLSNHVNDTVAGLMNASLGNAPELVIALFALFKGEYAVVKESLIGSILSNLLLVLGSSLLLGGFRFKQQNFSTVLVSSNSVLLFAGVIATFIPTTLVSSGTELKVGSALLASRIVSIFLLFLYGSFLIFQLKTHKELFDEEEEKGEEGEGEATSDGVGSTAEAVVDVGASGAKEGLAMNTREAQKKVEGDEEEEGGEENFTFSESLVGLAIVAGVVAFVSEILVDALGGASLAWGLSPAFCAAILLPVAGNAAEHTSALIFAYKNRLDLALGICVGSAVQIYAFVIPVLVVVGWAANQPLALDFKPFEYGLLFFAVLVTANTLSSGKSTYFSGMLHVIIYAIMCTGYLLFSGQCPRGYLEVFDTVKGSNCIPRNTTSSSTKLLL